MPSLMNCFFRSSVFRPSHQSHSTVWVSAGGDEPVQSPVNDRDVALVRNLAALAGAYRGWDRDALAEEAGASIEAIRAIAAGHAAAIVGNKVCGPGIGCVVSVQFSLTSIPPSFHHRYRCCCRPIRPLSLLSFSLLGLRKLAERTGGGRWHWGHPTRWRLGAP